MNIYFQFLSFLLVDMVDEILHVRENPIYITVNIMAADDMVAQGTRASATMILI